LSWYLSLWKILLEGFFRLGKKKPTKKNIRNLVSTVNPIVNPLHVQRWDSHKRHLVVRTKIVINNLPFTFFLCMFLEIIDKKEWL